MRVLDGAEPAQKLQYPNRLPASFCPSYPDGLMRPALTHASRSKKSRSARESWAASQPFSTMSSGDVV